MKFWNSDLRLMAGLLSPAEQLQFLIDTTKEIKSPYMFLARCGIRFTLSNTPEKIRDKTIQCWFTIKYRNTDGEMDVLIPHIDYFHTMNPNYLNSFPSPVLEWEHRFQQNKMYAEDRWKWAEDRWKWLSGNHRCVHGNGFLVVIRTCLIHLSDTFFYQTYGKLRTGRADQVNISYFDIEKVTDNYLELYSPSVRKALLEELSNFDTLLQSPSDFTVSAI